MVKLVTSRAPRCYSAVSAVRSARNERINDFVHVAAVSLLLGASSLELAPVASRLKLDRHVLAMLGSMLLVWTQLIDLHAASSAHRQMHGMSRFAAKRRPLTEVATRVDWLVSALCLCGAICQVVAAKLGGSSTSADVSLCERAAAAAAAFLAAAAFANAVLGLPAVIVKIPPTLARYHNGVVALFTAGAYGNLIVTFVILAHDPRFVPVRDVLATAAVTSYALIWLGAIVNVARTKALLARPRRADSMDSDDTSGKSGNNGLFSWFKASKSDTALDSEYDSDDVDEEDGFTSEEETYSRRKSRR